MDSIILKDIRFHGFHGVPTEEREVGGHYEVDAIIKYPLAKAGKTDALEYTIDYAKVVDLITDIGTQKSFKLIEALAETIASEILKQFPVESVQIIVKNYIHPLNNQLHISPLTSVVKRNKYEICCTSIFDHSIVLFNKHLRPSWWEENTTLS